MLLEGIPADDPNLEKKIRDIIIKEVKDGLLKKCFSKYPDAKYNFEIEKIKSKSNFSCYGTICNERDEVVLEFTIDNNFELQLITSFIYNPNI